MEFLILLVFCWTMPIIQIVMFRLLINWIIKRKKTKIMKYEITKEQIESLRCVMNISSCENGISFLKEWFPDAFKTDLEAGEWYFVERPEEEFCDKQSALIFYEDKNDLYGFDHGGTWINHYGNPKNDKYTFTKATESEVFEALKKEALRRYKVGDYIKTHQGTNVLKTLDIVHSLKYNQGIYNKQDYGLWLFMNGQWAEIIETISKEEAEKLLNKKII